MRPPAILIATLFALACRPGDDPSQSPPAEPDPDPVPPVETAAGGGTSTPASGPCVGDESGLDLSAIGADACPVQGLSQPPPPDAVETFLYPTPLDLAGFGRGDLRLAVVNVTEQPVTFDLALGCGPWHGVTVVAVPEDGGDPIPFAPGELRDGQFAGFCAKAARCGLRPVRISLAASGRAYVPLTLDLQARTFDEHCDLDESDPLPEGRYVLEASLPANEAIPAAKGTLRVSG